MKIADVEPRGAAVSDEELRAVLRAGLGAGCGRVAITGLSRRPLGSATSYPAEAIELRTDPGGDMRLFLKDMSSSRIPKEGLEDRRRREVTVYRDLLSRLEAGTPRYHGAIHSESEGRLCLLLEYVEGATLETLDFDHWVLAARWLGRFHGMLDGQEPGPDLARALELHGHGYFRSTADRAMAAVRQVSPALAVELARPLRDYEGHISLMTAQPYTLVHGSFRPFNILVDTGVVPPRICPVDWELAAWGSRLYDMAFLADGCGAPDLDTYWTAYGEGAAVYGMEVPALDDVWGAFDSFYLHKLLKSLSGCASWPSPEPTVATLVRLVEERTGAS